jgi:hypothetical protein
MPIYTKYEKTLEVPDRLWLKSNQTF